MTKRNTTKPRAKSSEQAEAAMHPPPAKSWTALAKAVGVSRKTIWHLRDHEGGPATLQIEPWQKFLEERANQNENHSNAENAAEEIKAIRVKLLRAQAGKEEAIRKLRELELERVKEGLVPISEAKQVIRQTLGPLRGLLDSLPKAVAVQANPVEPELAEEAVRHGLDKVFEGIAKELKA